MRLKSVYPVIFRVSVSFVGVPSIVTPGFETAAAVKSRPVELETSWRYSSLLSVLAVGR